jgi:hypothetical protein
MSDSERQTTIARRKQRIDDAAEDRLANLDKLHGKLDTRGYTSQTGQALLDLLYVTVTQLVADVADFQGQLLDLQLTGSMGPLIQAEHLLTPSRKKRIERVTQAFQLRQGHPDMTQGECARLFGVSAPAYCFMLAEARRLLPKEAPCQTEP